MNINLASKKLSWTLVATISFLGVEAVSAPSFADVCSRGDSSGSGLEHGAAISSNQVTVCVESHSYSQGETQVTTVRTEQSATTITKKKKKPKSAPKVAKPAPKVFAAPVKPAVVSCPTPKQMAATPLSADARERWIRSLCSPAPVMPIIRPKPSPTKKPAPKMETVSTPSYSTTVTVGPPRRISNEGNAQFTSNALHASNFPSTTLAIDQPVTFSSDATLHFRTSTIIGKRAEVKFSPNAVFWSFGDGTEGIGSTVSRSYAQAGVYLVFARVSYSVSYRLLGESDWRAVGGGISSLSNRLWVSVANEVSPPDRPISEIPLLVGELCPPNSFRFGCTQ
jgi:hypothetical protein